MEKKRSSGRRTDSSGSPRKTDLRDGEAADATETPMPAPYASQEVSSSKAPEFEPSQPMESSWEPPRDPVSMESAPSPPDSGTLAHRWARAQRTRGLPWASTVGWVVATLGLAIIAYAFWWSVDNYPENYNPGGISGLRLGAALTLAGLFAAILFLFVPRRASNYSPQDSSPTWERRAVVAHYFWRTNRVLSKVGLGLLFLGLGLTALVYRNVTIAGPETKESTLAGVTLTYNQWAGIFLAFAAVGLFLWALMGVRAHAYRHVFFGAAAAAQRSGVGQATPETMPSMEREASVPSTSEVVALMKKLDGLLAALPDETVGAFSKTPEAETYLKLLSAKSASAKSARRSRE